MEKEDWKYILINGKNTKLSVKNPVFEKGILTSLESFKPFIAQDNEGNPIEPTIEDTQKEKRRIYNDFFKKNFKNLLILSGAGSSMDVGGLSMNDLWNKVEEKYKIGGVDNFKQIRESVNYKTEKNNLEAFLSQIDGYSKLVEDKELEIGDKHKKLTTIKAEIIDSIRDCCTIPQPKEIFPHKIILEKLLQRKQTSERIKIFTLNYDLLWEYAAAEVNAIVIDGFSFVTPRTFSGRFFDFDIVQREGSKLKEEDNFIQRVFHLHKIHGSLNWDRNEEGKILINEKPKIPLMIYPRESKYEDSYEQPFFEMMARFQRNLRLDNDTMLICIGYSFNDKHINAAIEEALNQNPGFRIAIVDPYFDYEDRAPSLLEIKKVAHESERILMISETFTDFAKYYPEIQTYANLNQEQIYLKNEIKN